MRDSPPDEARAWAGAWASTNNTRSPAARRCHAVQAPNTPAPTTTVSHDGATVLAVRRFVAACDLPPDTNTLPATIDAIASRRDTRRDMVSPFRARRHVRQVGEFARISADLPQGGAKASATAARSHLHVDALHRAIGSAAQSGKTDSSSLVTRRRTSAGASPHSQYERSAWRCAQTSCGCGS
jgi:hypothetical protein